MSFFISTIQHIFEGGYSELVEENAVHAQNSRSGFGSAISRLFKTAGDQSAVNSSGAFSKN